MLLQKSIHFIKINIPVSGIISSMDSARNIEHIQTIVRRALHIGQYTVTDAENAFSVDGMSTDFLDCF